MSPLLGPFGTKLGWGEGSLCALSGFLWIRQDVKRKRAQREKARKKKKKTQIQAPKTSKRTTMYILGIILCVLCAVQPLSLFTGSEHIPLARTHSILRAVQASAIVITLQVISAHVFDVLARMYLEEGDFSLDRATRRIIYSGVFMFLLMVVCTILGIYVNDWQAVLVSTTCIMLVWVGLTLCHLWINLLRLLMHTSRTLSQVDKLHPNGITIPDSERPYQNITSATSSSSGPSTLTPPSGPRPGTEVDSYKLKLPLLHSIKIYTVLLLISAMMVVRNSDCVCVSPSLSLPALHLPLFAFLSLFLATLMLDHSSLTHPLRRCSALRLKTCLKSHSTVVTVSQKTLSSRSAFSQSLPRVLHGVWVCVDR